MTTALLETIDLCRTFHDGSRELEVLRGIHLEVRRGEAVAIVGASGSGKSTLLHLLAGLDQPTSGDVLLEGQRYSEMGNQALAKRRAETIGIVYQAHHLLAEFNAMENVSLAARVAGKSGAEADAMAAEALEAVGLGDRLRHRPMRLSGGEQQRVSLARALVNNPDVVLADEPTGSLDLETSKISIELLWKSTLEKDRALVIVTHESTIAERADRILRLHEGRLRQEPAGASASG